MIALVAKGKREALVDSLEIQTTAHWSGQMFARQKSLSGKVLRDFLPRQPEMSPEAAQDAELAKWDNWAKGVNEAYAALNPPKVEQ